MAQLGKGLIICGLILMIIGALLVFSEKFPWLRLGRLPGDFSWSNSSGTVRIYLPLMTGLLLSGLLTLVFWLLRK